MTGEVVFCNEAQAVGHIRTHSDTFGQQILPNRVLIELGITLHSQTASATKSPSHFSDPPKTKSQTLLAHDTKIQKYSPTHIQYIPYPQISKNTHRSTQGHSGRSRYAGTLSCLVLFPDHVGDSFPTRCLREVGKKITRRLRFIGITGEFCISAPAVGPSTKLKLLVQIP